MVCKDLMQGKLFQKCTHLLYCSELSLGGNVNTRRMSKPDMGSIFQINSQWNILVIGNYYVNYQNYQNSMLLTSLDTKRMLMQGCNARKVNCCRVYSAYILKDGSHIRLRHLSCVYITAQRQYTAVQKNPYTSEITFLALHPCTDASILVYKFQFQENWFQYVRRVYATAINFPCIKVLMVCMFVLKKRSNH